MRNPYRAGVVPVLLLSACAGFSPEQRSFYDQRLSQIAAGQTGLVSDGCVVRDEVGDDYVLRQSSEAVGRAVGTATAEYLKQRGIPVAVAVTPFVCGVAVDLDAKTMPVAEVQGAERAPTALPIALNERVRSDPALAEAYQKLIRDVVKSAPTPDVEAGQALPTPARLSLREEQRSRLRSELGVPDIWVVRAGGMQVSFGKTLGMALLTAAVSGGASGGAFISYSMPVDGNGYDVALVNLDSSEIVWRKRLLVQRGDPANVGNYTGEWAGNVLDPFIPLKGGAILAAKTGAEVSARSAPAPTLATEAGSHQSRETSLAPTAATAVASTPTVGSPVSAPAVQTGMLSTPTPAVLLNPETAPPVTGAQTVENTASGARVLSAPRTLSGRPAPSGEILTQLPVGTTVEVLSSVRNAQGTWWYVRTGDRTGWLPAQSAE